MQVRILLATALLTVSVLPAGAQAVKVSFHGGKVDLSAQNATVRAILNEWARVGGTRIVNAERLSGPPITVEFTAPAVGHYEIACSEFCGSGHGHMKAALISVAPVSTNR